MEMPASGATNYSFPVIVGFTDAEPLSTRSARMKIYTGLVRNLDSGGAQYSQDLSEVDLSDPEDAKVTVADGGVVVHLGNSNYLDRYKIYVSHLQEWKQQYGALKSVDLRYDNQVIVDPAAPAPALAATASTAPQSAPVKAQNKVLGAWQGGTAAKSTAPRHKVVARHKRRAKRTR
jgi:cell division protein FtsQ